MLPLVLMSCGIQDSALQNEGKVETLLKINVLGVDEVYGTKSVLPEETIEGKVTDVTLAAYGMNGMLTDVKYFTSDFSAMAMDVRPGESCTVYALANMGDMSGTFPLDESSVANMEYRLTSYESVASGGIPMCGSTSVSEAGEQTTVDLSRLFAKVRVRIRHSGLYGYDSSKPTSLNMCNRSIYVRQANSLLRPFAEKGSKAESVSDIMDISDYNPDLNNMDVYDGTLEESELGYGPGYLHDISLTLYVPENVQGRLLPDNEDPYGKVYDNINGLDDKQYGDLCTYIEFNASRAGGQGYSGDVMYRYYLGMDNTSDFSVDRNCCYDMTLDFTEDGFFVDSWKVSRGEDWTDNRTLRFVEAPFRVSPGGTENVMIHFHRHTANVTGSELYPERWRYSIDEEAVKAAGLSVSFDPGTLITGLNGFKDFCLKISASPNAKVGVSFPISVSTTDGSITDETAITIVPKNNFEAEWDFRPEYVSQYGSFTLGGYEVSDLPFKCSVPDGSGIKCVSVDDDTFRIVAECAGETQITIYNSDGSKSSVIYVDIAAPVLWLGGLNVNLNPDGEIISVPYEYRTASGARLSNVDDAVFNARLKPVVSAHDNITASVSADVLDVYVSRLKGLSVGGIYNLTVSASDCSGVASKNIAASVTDPFRGISVRDYREIHDYTLLGLPSVNAVIRNKFTDLIKANSSFVFDGPVPEADPAYVSVELAPKWYGRFSKNNGVYSLDRDPSTGRLTITQNTINKATQHSAGAHEINLLVKNRHSSEVLPGLCGTLDIYVHAVIGARAVFNRHRCDLPAVGLTFAEVYNAVSGGSVYYSPASTKYIHYMDVVAELVPQADGVHVFEMLDALNGAYGAYSFLQPSNKDGSSENSLLFSVGDGYGDRVGVCGEPSGKRGGINNHLYRALYTHPMDYTQSETNLRKLFLGYESGSASGAYAPAYVVFDRSGSKVNTSVPFYFSPSNCDEFRDSEGKGYHVFHFLESVFPATAGWLNLL